MVGWAHTNICLWLPPDRNCQKVNDSKVDYSGDLDVGKVGHDPRLELCWTLLVIGPLIAMWTLDPNLGPGTYACLWLKLDSKVQCYTRGTKVSTLFAHPKVVQPNLEAKSTIDFNAHPAQMPDGPAKIRGAKPKCWFYLHTKKMKLYSCIQPNSGLQCEWEN